MTILKYFKGSFLIAIIGLITAFLWGKGMHNAGLSALFTAAFLSVLEVTLSFDNAVINAVKLEKLTDKWRHRFITWGILIAVFGMRLIFPIIIVSIFAHLSVFEAANLAVNDINEYTKHLKTAHAPLVTFGGSFLMMIFLSFFFNPDKECHWLKFIEKHMQKLHNIKYFDAVCVMTAIIVLQRFMPEDEKTAVMTAGLAGIITYLIVDSISSLLENIENKKAQAAGSIGRLGFIGFLYLELIDASFSLDGVLGSFAITQDIIIICIGLAIGAMFVRSLTIYMVEKGTLKQFIYLEHGAHWAIGFLALIMFIGARTEVPEIITGGIGLLFISSAFISSILHNRKIEKENAVQKIENEA